MENTIITEKYKLRLKGYAKAQRGDFLLIQKKVLTDTEFVLFRLLKDVVVDWDTKHLTYGTFFYNSHQVSFYLGWNYAKINRIFNKLQEKGLLLLVDKQQKLWKTA